MSDIYEELMGLTRAEVLAKLQAAVKPKRYQHCLGVEKAARQLADRYGGNSDKAALAGLLHDYAKALPAEDFFRLIDRYQLDPALKNWNSSIWHGMVGIYKISEDLGLTDREILHAIEVHTVGAATMTRLDKVVYVADYIEENRDFDGVEKARQLADASLDAAAAYETARTVEYLAAKHLPIYPQTLETYNAFISYLPENKGDYKIPK
jgi:predicted HD superfamily hydrolase involved in NAD metabolism